MTVQKIIQSEKTIWFFFCPKPKMNGSILRVVFRKYLHAFVMTCSFSSPKVRYRTCSHIPNHTPTEI